MNLKKKEFKTLSVNQMKRLKGFADLIFTFKGTVKRGLRVKISEMFFKYSRFFFFDFGNTKMTENKFMQYTPCIKM